MNKDPREFHYEYFEPLLIKIGTVVLPQWLVYGPVTGWHKHDEKTTYRKKSQGATHNIK